MVFYVRRRKGDGYVKPGVTEDGHEAVKYSRGFKPVNIKEISINDIAAYFRIQVPEKHVSFSAHSTFKNVIEASDDFALTDYIHEVAEMLALNPFDPKRAKLEAQRKENREGLAALVAKEKK